MHDLSPEPVVHLSQHKLLPLLLDRAHSIVGPQSIRFGHQLSHFQQGANGVTCHIQPLKVSLAVNFIHLDCSSLLWVMLLCCTKRTAL